MKSIRKFVLLCGVASLGACASGARPGAMTAPLDAAHIIDSKSPLYQGVTVDPVTGGEETNPLLASKVSNAAFKAALEQSLQVNAMLAATMARYKIDVTLIDLKQPLIGFDMKVTALAHYVVTPAQGGAPVFDQIITSPYTANFSDAFVGVERLRLANEGAVRANISDFISALAAAKLPTPAT